MRTNIAQWILICSLTLGAATGCTDDSSKKQRADDAPVARRIDITPNGALLTPAIPSIRLRATVRDQFGRPIEGAVTWESEAPTVIQVGSDGTATALVTVGSAILRARSGDVHGEVLLIAAQPAAGAVVIGDENLIGAPVPKDDTLPFGVGFQYDVTLTGVAAPNIGSMLLANGEQPVSGRVVAVSGSTVTLEVRPLDEVVPQLDISATLDLSLAPFTVPDAVAEAYVSEQLADGSYRLTPRTGQQASFLHSPLSTTFNAGPFECEADFSAIQLSLYTTAINFTPALSLDFVWNGAQKKLVIAGEPRLELAVTPTASVAFSGELVCKMTVHTIRIPFPGFLGVAVGGTIPFGPGFSLEGSVPMGQVGAEFQTTLAASARFGFDCNPDCATVTELSTTADGKVTPVYPTALAGVKVEAALDAFIFADLNGGLYLVRWAQVEAIESKAGLSFNLELAAEQTQSDDPDFKTAYGLTAVSSIGAGRDFERFLGLVSVDVASLEATYEWPLGSSPESTRLTANKVDFQVGDVVEFKVTLDPGSTEFPILGYNVAAVRLYRKTPSGLLLANEVQATAGQTAFQFPWVATVSGTVRDNFIVFIETKLFSEPRLELGNPVPETELPAFVSCQETYEFTSELIDGADFIRIHEVRTQSGSFTLEFDSSVNGSTKFNIVGGAASVTGTYDHDEHTTGLGQGLCTYNETLSTHSTRSGSGGGIGVATLNVQPNGAFKISAGLANSFEVTTSSTFSAQYDFTGEVNTCRSQVSNSHQEVDDEWVEIEASGTGTPGEEHEFTAVEAHDEGVGATRRITCTLTK